MGVLGYLMGFSYMKGVNTRIFLPLKPMILSNSVRPQPFRRDLTAETENTLASLHREINSTRPRPQPQVFHRPQPMPRPRDNPTVLGSGSNNSSFTDRSNRQFRQVWRALFKKNHLQHGSAFAQNYFSLIGTYSKIWVRNISQSQLLEKICAQSP